IGTRLDINPGIPNADPWPVTVSPDVPLVIVANHPFGIGDGIAILALAEQLDRPYRILANREFLKVPEIRHWALPIDFSANRAAVEPTLASRNLGRRLFRVGGTVVGF